MRLPTFDLYAELGVDPSVDHAALVDAFRCLAKASHPDVSGDTLATARMARLNAAREILFNQDLRAAYDRSRGLQPAGRQKTRAKPSRRWSARDPFPARDGRIPPLNQCPICPWPPRVGERPHCALGHAGERPVFGGPRRFELDPAEHGKGLPFTPDEEVWHRTRCRWFATTMRPAGEVTTGDSAEFRAVGRIRRQDGVALDPTLLSALDDIADGEAVREALAYAVAGRVLLLARYGDQLRSVVCGRHAYNVELNLDGGEFRTPTRASCDCPSYRSMCKHSLSTWVVWYFSAGRSTL